MTDLTKTNPLHQDITGSIEFMQPEWIWILPILLLATLVWRSVGSRKQPASLATGQRGDRSRMLHPLISLIPKHNFITKTSMLNAVLCALAIAGLVVSLAEPVLIGERLPDPPQERDIIFIVDTSISMTLKDYVLEGRRIDRMTLLKAVLDKFIQQLPGERVGIIVFGDAAYTLVPLTNDHDLLRRMLARVQATMVGRYNNMGEAIALAVKQTYQHKEENRHRVLVLLTDADKPTGTITPQTAADLAFDEGLPLYTVAIGSTTPEAEEKRTTGLIYEPVDIKLLTEISEKTGARNYQAGNSQALEQAIYDIAENETNKRNVEPLYFREALYQWPLLFSVILLSVLTIIATLKQSVPQSFINISDSEGTSSQ